MQVVVAPFLVLRRLQIGNFVVFFFFCLPVFTPMRTRLRAPHRFSFQPPVRMIAYLGHKCSGPIEILKNVCRM